jgi:3-dehydroquinate dehydratase-2
MKGRILLINGPNLNMLGWREPEKYGSTTLDEIVRESTNLAYKLGYELVAFQSNSEGEIVDFIQREGISSVGIVINAGAYTHTSVAIRDALLSVNVPVVEVHMSNVFRREPFRHVSYLSDIAIGSIVGFKENSYYLGILALVSFLEGKKVSLEE